MRGSPMRNLDNKPFDARYDFHSWIEITSLINGCTFSLGLTRYEGHNGTWATMPDETIMSCQYRNSKCQNRLRTENKPYTEGEPPYKLQVTSIDGCTHVCMGLHDVQNKSPNDGYPVFDTINEGNLSEIQLMIIYWLLSKAKTEHRGTQPQYVTKLPFTYSLTCALPVLKSLSSKSKANCQTFANDFHQDSEKLFVRLNESNPMKQMAVFSQVSFKNNKKLKEDFLDYAFRYTAQNKAEKNFEVPGLMW